MYITYMISSSPNKDQKYLQSNKSKITKAQLGMYIIERLGKIRWSIVIRIVIDKYIHHDRINQATKKPGRRTDIDLN
ncbi:hypothetical protein Leryth_004066, partial [Lithospermum erythrorhizon]